MRVLVVEDVRASQMTSPKACRGEAMAVDVVYDGLEAIIKLDVNRYDVVVLDRDLPGLHGDAVCRKITRRDRSGHGADAYGG